VKGISGYSRILRGWKKEMGISNCTGNSKRMVGREDGIKTIEKEFGIRIGQAGGGKRTDESPFWHRSASKEGGRRTNTSNKEPAR